ncbi:choice-of-anchor U domain-containing protein [Synechococcus sp.]|uniref:choice-of-anchor U domain-containing protein n=1 Tax=Synechococcus sp. TaxID=1131 RepID=UPI0034A42210
MIWRPCFDGLNTTNKRLAYFVYDSPLVGAAPVATPFTYDPVKKAGARFYDLDGNGSADTVDLQFVDGGYGDKDGIKNGVVVDPSTAGVVDLNAIFTATANRPHRWGPHRQHLACCFNGARHPHR